MRKPDQKTNPSIDHFDHWDRSGDCFGEFRSTNPLCTKHCAVRLRCVIELHQNMRLEIIEDLVSAESQLVTIQ